MAYEGRQYPLSVYFSFTWDDSNLSAGVITVPFPANGVVVGGAVIVDTAWNSVTSDNIDVGDAGDVDRYTASPINLAATGRTALTLTGYEAADDSGITLTITSVGGSLSAGAARIHIDYLAMNKANEVQE